MLLGVLSLRFEKLTFLWDSLVSPVPFLSSLHRSRTGIISLRVRLVISDLGMLFDLVPETRLLGLENGGPTMSGTSSQTYCFFFTESACDNGNAPACDTNFQCHLCGDWVSSSKGRSAHLRAKHAILQCRKVVCKRMQVLPLFQGHFLFASKTVSSRPMLLP